MAHGKQKPKLEEEAGEGAPLWIIDGPTEQFVASLVYNGDLLFMTCGFPEFFLEFVDTAALCLRFFWQCCR